MSTQNCSKSIIVLPFKIINEDINNDPFEIKNHNLVEDKKCLSNFLDKMKGFDCIGEKIIDNKYHDFIRNYISNQIEVENKSFLKYYAFSQEHYIKQKKFDFKKVNFFLGDSQLNITFHKNTYVIINESASLGYFVLNFDMSLEDNTSSILEELAKVTFFRFYKPQQVQKNSGEINSKYQIRVEDGDNIPSIQYSMFLLIEDFFKPIMQNIKFLYEKPIALHLLKSDKNFIDKNALIKNIYKTLRVSATIDDGDQYLSDYMLELKTPDFNVRFMAMNEGAVVIDNGCQNLKDLENKYFPAFLLALNQREIMILTNRKISTINYDKVLENNLSKLKNDIHLFQLKQMFYSISFFSEIDQFFSELQNKFRVESLLKDNKEGIHEIHELLENKRNKQVTNLLVVLSMIQGLLAFISIFGLNTIAQKIATVLVLTFTILMYFIWDKWKSKNKSFKI